MKNLLHICIIFWVTTQYANAQKPASDPDGNWVLQPQYSDEFDGPLDLQKWDNDINDWGDWVWEPENTWTKDGKLIIRMGYGQNKNGWYNSGIIRSKAEPILYGYFEARMKGADRFPGVCPAFWLYKQTGTLWTEIDIMEMQETSWNVNALDMNTHTFKPEELHERRHWDAPWDPADDFHTYGCKWDEDGITWYIDGVQRAYRKNEHWHQALDVTMSLGLRAPLRKTADPNGFPTTFETDYIRVWIKSDSPAENIAIINPPAEMVRPNKISYDVSYSAAQQRDIVLSLSSPMENGSQGKSKQFLLVMEQQLLQ